MQWNWSARQLFAKHQSHNNKIEAKKKNAMKKTFRILLLMLLCLRRIWMEISCNAMFLYATLSMAIINGKNQSNNTHKSKCKYLVRCRIYVSILENRVSNENVNQIQLNWNFIEFAQFGHCSVCSHSMFRWNVGPCLFFVVHALGLSCEYLFSNWKKKSNYTFWLVLWFRICTSPSLLMESCECMVCMCLCFHILWILFSCIRIDRERKKISHYNWSVKTKSPFVLSFYCENGPLFCFCGNGKFLSSIYIAFDNAARTVRVSVWVHMYEYSSWPYSLVSKQIPVVPSSVAHNRYFKSFEIVEQTFDWNFVRYLLKSLK